MVYLSVLFLTTLYISAKMSIAARVSITRADVSIASAPVFIVLRFSAVMSRSATAIYDKRAILSALGVRMALYAIYINNVYLLGL